MLHISFRRWYHDVYSRINNHLSWASPLVPYYILGILFCINLLIMWPGHMSPDSYTQYKAAVQGIFDDHHPPMMSLAWGFLDSIYKGPGLLFFAHLLMLYSACLLFIMSSHTRSLKIFYSLFPLIPHVLFYSAMLWKDVGFAFSFLLAMALLHWCIIHKKQCGVGVTIGIGILIFYGSAVKFQGQYVAPIIIFGMCYCLDNYKIRGKTVLMAVLVSWFFLHCLHAFNDFFVPTERKAHSWQCVKIYDLAALSLYAKQPLFPSFITSHPDFSMLEVKERFNHKRVDDLFMPPCNPLRLGKDDAERAQLLIYWQQTVLKHMPLYLYHRFMNWWTMVTNMPLQHFDTMDFSQFGGLRWFVALRTAARQEEHATINNTLMHYAGKFIHGFLYALRYCFKFVFLIPFMIFYLMLGLIYFKRYGQGILLILMNGLSLWFLGILFFFSMASDMRYAYIASCMTHASHGIALELWRKNRMKGAEHIS